MSKIRKNLQLLFTRPKDVFSYLFPGRTSYSQSGEDMILDFLFRQKRGGMFVDVGANHPSRLSNTLFFYKNRSWRGINIEPNPSLWKKFVSSRRGDINLNVGVAENSGELTFYELSPDTLSTFSREAADDYVLQGHPLVKEYTIPVISLEKLFAKYVGETKIIDFLSVDTEGYDMEVLKSNDWKKYRPKAIVLETLEYKKNGGGMKLDKVFGEYLAEKNYVLYADTYINSIFISREFAQEISFQ